MAGPAGKISAIFAIFVLLIAGPSPAFDRDGPTFTSGRPIQTGVTHELTSNVMGDTRQINVWVPPKHGKSDEKYTVLYLLDGALDQDFHHIAGLAQLASLSWTFGPLIVVGVQTRNRQSELTPMPSDSRYVAAFRESGEAERFRRFLQEEVIPVIERRYPASGRRAIMGESLAGLFVLDTLLTQPALFDDYIAISPSLWWDDRKLANEASQKLSATNVPGRRVYLAMADEGGTMQDGVDRLRAAIGDRGQGEIELCYSDRSAIATHSTIYHTAAEEALRWLYPAPPYVVGPTPWYMIDGASPTSADGS